MPRFLPLFPLHIVVFPGEKLNLHIFEPRYKQLVKECFAAGSTFAIPAFINNKISDLATEVKIISIEKTYPKGEMDIKTKALGLVRVVDFYKQAPNKFYPAGTVEDVTPDMNEDQMLRLKITENLRQFYSILGVQKLLMEFPVNYKIFDIAHHLGFTTEEEYELLQCKNEISRQEKVLEHLQKILPILLQTQKLKDRVKLNGHFKNIIPPNF